MSNTLSGLVSNLPQQNGIVHKLTKSPVDDGCRVAVVHEVENVILGKMFWLVVSNATVKSRATSVVKISLCCLPLTGRDIRCESDWSTAKSATAAAWPFTTIV